MDRSEGYDSVNLKFEPQCELFNTEFKSKFTVRVNCCEHSCLHCQDKLRRTTIRPYGAKIPWPAKLRAPLTVVAVKMTASHLAYSTCNYTMI